MSSERRRRARDSPDRYHSRKHRRASSPSPDSPSRNPEQPKKPSFPSYLDEPDLPPKIRILCEIVSRTPSPSLDAALDASGVRVSSDDAEAVLKLSYSYPSQALKFFRWTSAQLPHGHTPYAWNLVVDLLGKNALFDAMWDAVRSMRADGSLSLATFASIFSSYASHARVDAALDAFLQMGSTQMPVPRDAAALNSLLSALCRHGQTPRALSLLLARSLPVPPDRDSFAIVLEGCDDLRDPDAALRAFSSMVDSIGWDPSNVPAYDSFLCALARASPPAGGLLQVLKHLDLLLSHGCPPGTRFYRTALEEAVRLRDVNAGSALWRILMGPASGCRPDVGMYNSMLALLCHSGQADTAFDMLDRMVEHAVFPDADTYNTMLRFLLKDRKLRDAAVVWKEMTRNAILPTSDNCAIAFKAFLDQGDGEMLLKVWRCMMDNNLGSLDECGNNLVLRLREIDMLPEACKYAEEMVEKGIKVNSSTLSKLRTNLVKLGRGSVYDQIMKKWKSH